MVKEKGRFPCLCDDRLESPWSLFFLLDGGAERQGESSMWWAGCRFMKGENHGQTDEMPSSGLFETPSPKKVWAKVICRCNKQRMLPTVKPPATAATTNAVHRGEFSWRKRGHWPRSFRCISKERLQWPQTLASSHTQTSSKIANLRCLLLWLAVIFWCLAIWFCFSPSKNYIPWLLPSLFGAVPWSYLRGHLLSYTSQKVPE